MAKEKNTSTLMGQRLRIRIIHEIILHEAKPTPKGTNAREFLLKAVNDKLTMRGLPEVGRSRRAAPRARPPERPRRHAAGEPRRIGRTCRRCPLDSRTGDLRSCRGSRGHPHHRQRPASGLAHVQQPREERPGGLAAAGA